VKKKKKKFGVGLKGRLVHESEILKRVQQLKVLVDSMGYDTGLNVRIDGEEGVEGSLNHSY